MRWESRKTRARNRPEAGPPPLDPVEAEAQEALEQVPDFGYIDEEPFHGKITASIRDKAEKMFQMALEDPNSDANLMVRIMLLNQVAKVEAERYRQDPKLVLTEERRRGAEHVRQLEKGPTPGRRSQGKEQED